MLWNRLPITMLLLTQLGAASAPTQRGVAPLQATNDQPAVAQFTDAIDRYMSLRWTVQEPFVPEEFCSDPEERQRGLARFVQAIRSKRAAARAGDIFTPAVASFFRQHMAAVEYELGYDFATYLEDTDIQALIEFPRLEVNGVLRWNTGDAVSPLLLRRLPPLPAELEYRLFGRDLVLVDAEANLVIDILEDAEGGS